MDMSETLLAGFDYLLASTTEYLCDTWTAASALQK